MSTAAGASPEVAFPHKHSSKDAFITRNPVDLTHVVQITKFRSCAGHDYSPGAANPDGSTLPNKSLEWGRSMKHYIFVNLPDSPAGTMKGYAPFNGTIQFNVGKTGSGIGVTVLSSDGQWAMTFAHVDPLVREGATVKAGQPVMAWPPKDLPAYNDIKYGPGNHPDVGVFDLVLEGRSASGARNLQSPLAHMVPAVAKAWADKGFTPANAILSKRYRDDHPCTLGPDNFQFVPGMSVDDLVNAIGYTG